MNIYDTNESVELYDNRGIEMARKCIRRAKRECAFRYLILLLLFALGMVDKILFPQIEIKLSSYILLYVICMFSMMGFRIFHNGIVAKRMKDFTLQEKHDYNLVIYRENHNKKFFLKSITPPLYCVLSVKYLIRSPFNFAFIQMLLLGNKRI